MINTDMYLALGLAVVLGVMLVYTGSLVLRIRQAHKMIDTLETLQEQ